MEKLILKVNGNLSFFTSRDVRVVVINGEPPMTNKNWIEQRNLEIEVFSDPSLEVGTVLMGTRDWNELLLSKGIRLSSPYPIISPGVVLLNNLGVLKNKLTVPDPSNVTATLRDVERMAGLSA